MNSENNLLNNNEAAKFLSISPETLEVWRSSKRYQIQYMKIGRSVRYRKEDLEKWLNSRMVCATAEL